MANEVLGLIHSIYSTKRTYKCLKCKQKMHWTDHQHKGYCWECYKENKAEEDSIALQNWENSFN